MALAPGCSTPAHEPASLRICSQHGRDGSVTRMTKPAVANEYEADDQPLDCWVNSEAAGAGALAAALEAGADGAAHTCTPSTPALASTTATPVAATAERRRRWRGGRAGRLEVGSSTTAGSWPVASPGGSHQDSAAAASVALAVAGRTAGTAAVSSAVGGAPAETISHPATTSSTKRSAGSPSSEQ